MRRVWMMVVSAVLLARVSTATVMVPIDLGGLSHEARVIVRGRVRTVDARWTENRRGVETLVTLDVEAYLKGPLGESVTFRVPGGHLGRFRSLVVGAPEFAEGQRVIVFLSYRGPGVPYLVGLGQGVYRLRPAESGWVVTPPALVASTETQSVVRGDPTRRVLAVAAFERQVRALLGGTP